MEAVQHFITVFSIVPVAAAALVGLVRYRRLGRTQRYLLVLVLLALAMEITSRAVMRYQRSNLFLAPIDTVLEFSMLALLYRRALRPGRLSRLIPGVAVLFVLGSALTYSPRLDTAQFSPVQHFLESVLVLVFVGAYFYREINRPVITRRLERAPVFWVSSGLLLYFLSNLLIFLSSNYVLHRSVTLSRQVWAIHALLYIFLNTLYTIALWLPAHEEGAHGPEVTQS